MTRHTKYQEPGSSAPQWTAVIFQLHLCFSCWDLGTRRHHYNEVQWVKKYWQSDNQTGCKHGFHHLGHWRISSHGTFANGPWGTDIGEQIWTLTEKFMGYLCLTPWIWCGLSVLRLPSSLPVTWRVVGHQYEKSLSHYLLSYSTCVFSLLSQLAG